MQPDTFIRELNARCNTSDRPYRLRWNPRTETYAIEQKVSRAHEVPAVGDDFVTSRVRDGYGLVMEFSPSPTMRCEDCGSRLILPILKVAEIRCEYCNSRPDTHEKTMWFTGYFPLCDRFLTYLERTAPKRNGAWAREMDVENDFTLSASKRGFRNSIQAVGGDYWKQLAQIQQVWYGNGPASFGRL